MKKIAEFTADYHIIIRGEEIVIPNITREVWWFSDTETEEMTFDADNSEKIEAGITARFPDYFNKPSKICPKCKGPMIGGEDSYKNSFSYICPKCLSTSY